MPSQNANTENPLCQTLENVFTLPNILRVVCPLGSTLIVGLALLQRLKSTFLIEKLPVITK